MDLATTANRRAIRVWGKTLQNNDITPPSVPMGWTTTARRQSLYLALPVTCSQVYPARVPDTNASHNHIEPFF